MNNDPQMQRVMLNLSYLMETYTDVQLDAYKGTVYYNSASHDWSTLDDPALTPAVADYNALMQALINLGPSLATYYASLEFPYKHI